MINYNYNNKFMKIWENKNYLISKSMEIKNKFVIISKNKNKIPFLKNKLYINKNFSSAEYAIGYLYGLKKINTI